jgi:hypothetical protein
MGKLVICYEPKIYHLKAVLAITSVDRMFCRWFLAALAPHLFSGANKHKRVSFRGGYKIKRGLMRRV